MSNGEFQSYCATVIGEAGDKLLIEVPGPFPEGHRMVTAMVAKDTGRIYSMGFTIDREYLQSFIDYQARFGMIDRHPTEDEMDTIMRSLASAFNESATNVMASFARIAVSALGSDPESIHNARIDSAAASLLKAYKSATGEVADKETMEALREDCREYIESIDNIPDNMPLTEVSALHEERLNDILNKYCPTSEEDRVKGMLTDAFRGGSDLNAAIVEYARYYNPDIDTTALTKQCIEMIYSGRQTSDFTSLVDNLEAIFQSVEIPFDKAYFIEENSK